MRKTIAKLRGFACITMALTVVSASLLSVAGTYRNDIDTFLETSSYRSEAGDDYRYEAKYSADELIQANKDLGERILEEGSVLLKNMNQALPLQASGDTVKVTLFGMRSYAPQFGGTVNATPNAGQNVNMDIAFNERGFEVNPEMVTFYQDRFSKYTPGLAVGANNSNSEYGAVVNEVPLSEYSNAPNNYADYSDAAIIVLGRDCTEANDYYPGASGIADSSEFSTSFMRNILGLSDDEKDLIKYVKDQGTFDKIIVLVNATTTMEIEDLDNDPNIDAIMWIGTPGNYGFYGVADVLNGTVSPSGKLPDTYAVNTAMSPAVQNMGVYVYSNADEIDDSFFESRFLRNSWYVAENESIYLGYKYYETRYFDSIVNPDSNASATIGASYPDTEWNYDYEVTYPFGYGLSYSTFDEEIVSANINLNGESTVEVKVTNTGSVAAKHAVTLYVSLPYEAGQVEKSAIQLIGYAKTGDALETQENRVIRDMVMLAPNESETMTITFDSDWFASYDENEGNGAYIFDAGTYYFALGNGAHDAIQNVLKAKGAIEGDAGTLVTSFVNDSKIVIDQAKSGETVQNQIQDMNLNNLGHDVTYLSRSNWEGTFPTELKDLEATDEMKLSLSNAFYDSLEVDTSQMPSHVFGEVGTTSDYKLTQAIGNENYDDEIYSQILSGVPFETMVQGSSISFQRITAVPEVNSPEVRSMGGIVGPIARLGRYNAEGTKYYLDPQTDENASYNTNTFATQPVVAATFSHRAASLQGEVFGNDVLWTGMIWWYGVGLNIHRTPYNARNNEYYSEDSVLTGLMGKDVVEQVTKYGGIAGIKHYAFNDQESNREGVSVYMTEQAARENELRCFQIPLESGFVGSVMTAYNRAGATYSSAHVGLISGILRGEWNFDKIVISDMLHGGENYMLPRESLYAGTDMMMSSANPWTEFNPEDLSQDPVMENALYEAWHHILYTVANSAAMNGLTDESKVMRVYPWWEIALISVVGIMALSTILLVGFGIYLPNVKKKEEV